MPSQQRGKGKGGKAAAARPNPDAARGARAYVKQKAVGKGSFGTVFLVKHSKTGKELVLKEVACKGLSISAAVKQVEEIHFLKRLNHPHLIKYHASFLDEVNLAVIIIMEYVEGGDLKQKIENRAKGGQPFAESLVLRWLVQCVSALHFCHHNLLLLHRDIKPANILLTKDSDVKLSDFGLSKSLAASNMQAQTKVGTPLYMSPELCQGQPYDRGADIWALGCTLYHAMALKPPWVDQAETGRGAIGNVINLMKVIISNPLDLQPLRATYSFDLCGLLASMVAKERDSRPALSDVLQMPWVQAIPQAKALAAYPEGGDAPPTDTPADTPAPAPDPPRANQGVLGTAAGWLQQLVGATDEVATAVVAAPGVAQPSVVAKQASFEGVKSPAVAMKASFGAEAHVAAMRLQRQATFKRQATHPLPG